MKTTRHLVVLTLAVLALTSMMLGVGSGTDRASAASVSTTSRSHDRETRRAQQSQSAAAVERPAAKFAAATTLELPYDVHGVVTSSFHELPIANATVEVWRESSPGVWALEDIALSGLDGSWDYPTSLSTAVRIRVIDTTTICQTVWLGGTSVNNARDVVAVGGSGTPADVTLPVVGAATIEGTVYNYYLMAPVAGVTVSLCPSGGDLSTLLASTTSAADGSYHFSGVSAADYILYFSDGAQRYWSQWYDYQDDPAWADPVVVDMPGSYPADVYLDPVRIQYHATLTTATATSDTDTFWAGRQLTLAADMYDTIWGDPLDSMPVVVQMSTNRVTWTTIGAALTDPDYFGSYTFGYTPPDGTPRYFRFAIATSADVVGTTSPDVLVVPALRDAIWENVACNGSSAPSTRVDGKSFLLTGSLRDQFMGPVTNAAVHVQQSNDGRTWIDASATIRQPQPGQYQAVVEAGTSTMFRFEVRPGSVTLPAWSPVYTVLAPRRVDCNPYNRTPKAGRKFEVGGWFWPRSKAGTHIARIVVQRKVGRVWKSYATYRPAIVNGAYNGSRARFKMSVKKRGSYRMRMTVPGSNGFLPAASDWVNFTAR